MHLFPTCPLLAIPSVSGILTNKDMGNDNPKIEVRDLRAGDWLWTHKNVLFSDIPDSAYRVYSALAAFADNKDQQSWPALITIAQRIHSSKSTVLRSMQILERCGLVKVERRDGTSNLYTLLPCKEVVLPTVKKAQSPHHRLVRFFHETTKRVRKITPIWSAKETAHLQRILKTSSLDEDQIEQLMLFFLACPRFKKFPPTLSVFFSAGIFTGLMNAMENDVSFWKELDNYLMRLHRVEKVQHVDIPMRSIREMVEKLNSKMSIRESV